MRTVFLAFTGLSLLAQAPPPPLQQPWDGVPEEFRKLPIGRLEIPSDLRQWQAQRAGIRSIVLSSLGGMPPLAGFFGKFFVFAASVQQGLIWLAFVGVINAIVGLDE